MLNTTPQKPRPTKTALWIVLLTAVVAGGYYFLRRSQPPTITEILGQAPPPSAKVIGTYRFTTGLTGRDGLNKAVIEIDESDFNAFASELGLEAKAEISPSVFQSDRQLEWWDPANLPESPVYWKDESDDLGTRQLYVKYEEGRMYIHEFFYGPR